MCVYVCVYVCVCVCVCVVINSSLLCYIGEVQYSSRVEDIRILKLEIKKMRRERAILSKSVSNVDDLRLGEGAKHDLSRG